MLVKRLLQATMMLQFSLPVLSNSSTTSSSTSTYTANVSTTPSPDSSLTLTKHVTTSNPSPSLTPTWATAVSLPAAVGAAAACLTANASCAATYGLLQSCWDTGVSGTLDPNDKATSANYRDCVCGDSGTTHAAAWPLCAACLRGAGVPAAWIDGANWALWGFCRTNDPNLYLFLLQFLDFTNAVLGPRNSGSGGAAALPLTGPITAVATLGPRFSYDPFANALPSGITSVVTAIVTPTEEPLPHTTTPTGTETAASASGSTTATASKSVAATTTATATGTSETETETGGLGGGHGGVNYTTGVYPNGRSTLYVVGPAKPVPTTTAAMESVGSAAGSCVSETLLLVLLGMAGLGIILGGGVY